MKLTKSWSDYLMGITEAVALKSKDSTKVGAILLGEDNQILLTAFNGPPIGVRDLEERFERPLKYDYASHAEQNLIAFAARYGIATQGKYIMCTHQPCPACAKSIIQAGITTVFVGKGTWVSQKESDVVATKNMFEEANVTTEFTCW